MTEETALRRIEPQPKIITANDIKVLDDLMLRTESLPDILHLRAAEWGYQLTEDDNKLLMDTYTKLDDILKEVAAFINIKFPGCERHLRAWHEIDFDTKIGSFKIRTNDREHIKREWRKGMFDLKSLIKVLKNESILLIEEHPVITSLRNFEQQVNMPLDQPVSVNVRSRVKSWVEVISWIAGIIGTAVTLYLAFK